MDKRLDEIMQAVEDIYRNLLLMEGIVGKDLLSDARKTLAELEIDDLQAIRRALENKAERNTQN